MKLSIPLALWEWGSGGEVGGSEEGPAAGEIVSLVSSRPSTRSIIFELSYNPLRHQLEKVNP